MNDAWKALSETIETIIAPANGVIGVGVRDIATGDEIGVRLDEPFPMASVSKTPILVAAYRLVDAGTLDLKERIELTDERRCFGSGILNYFDNGLQPTLRDLMHRQCDRHQQNQAGQKCKQQWRHGRPTSAKSGTQPDVDRPDRDGDHCRPGQCHQEIACDPGRQQHDQDCNRSARHGARA